MRFTPRIPKEIPIVLIGSDLDGRVFSEPTNTVLLSLRGASIVSHHKLSPQQELILRCPDRNIEALIRIVGQVGSSNGVHTYGLAFVDPHLNFWTPEFSTPTPEEIAATQMFLSCSSCKHLESIDRASLEAQTCLAEKSVLRFCKHCGFSTLWKVALPHPNPELLSSSAIHTLPPRALLAPAPPSTVPQTPSAYAAPMSAQVQPSLQTPATTQTNAYREPHGAVLTLPSPALQPEPVRVDRRKHPRARVNYSACVRHPERGDDIVQCEDMSRGGLRFKSKKSYYERSLIEIAVPYVAGQTLIFVPAQIISAIELPSEKLFRYGVAYLHRPKPTHNF